jgi:hypothetical protein
MPLRQKWRHIRRHDFPEAGLAVERDEPSVRNAVARLRSDCSGDFRQQPPANSAPPPIRPHAHATKNESTVLLAKPNGSDNFAVILGDKQAVGIVN